MIDPRDMFSSATQSDTHSPSVPLMKVSSPDEEIAYLRSEIAKREALLAATPHGREQLASPEASVVARNEIASSAIQEYRAMDSSIMHPAHVMSEAEIAGLELNLAPEDHDTKIQELYGIMMARGLKNALTLIERMNDPHLDDDFHRFLVQYLATTHTLPGVSASQESYRSIDTVLYEVTLPRSAADTQRPLREHVGIMEQLYAGLQSIISESSSGVSIEIGRSYASPHVVYYISVPRSSAAMFEKHILGTFPHARVNPLPDDYNIIAPQSCVAGALARYSFDEILPIKTFDQFDADPANVLINVFTKLAVGTEGAALQCIIHPIDQSVYQGYLKTLERLRKGEKLKDIHASESMFDTAKSIFSPTQDKTPGVPDQDTIEKVVQKVGSQLVRVTVRVVGSAATNERAEAIVRDITSAFGQFTDVRSNGISFDTISQKQIFAFSREFSYRTPAVSRSMVMNIHELATICHFPVSLGDQAELKQANFVTAPAPTGLDTTGILLGHNEHRGVVTPIHFSREDRVRHFYIIGQTGTGKTGFLMNMIIQDIKNGEGVCYVDPHGNDVQTILSAIPPERVKDVIYFDPAYTRSPMALNMLEYDPDRPEQMSLIIDELMNIFNQLFDMQAQGGAMFQQYFKNAAYAVMGHPESGNTLMEISRIMSDKEFRDMKLRYCKNPMVVQFWKNAESTTGEQGLQNFVPYITSKFDPLISNEFLRPIVAQEHSSFNMRDIMDNKKILLVNLSKGMLGELSANLLGLILIGKIQMAALSRAESHGVKFPDFYLYIDEFQNFTTPAIASILAEARKYRLSLNVAHQFLAQLDDRIKNAVLGNVGSMAVCRISPEDATALEQYFKPNFSVSDIIRLENMTSYTKLLVKGVPSEPFNMRNNDISDIYRNASAQSEKIQSIKDLSYLTYGRPRAEIEEEILAKFRKMTV